MDSNPKFIVFSLPRSRSAWISHFLRYDGRVVTHDALLDCARVQDFVNLFEAGLDGTCETAAMLGWQLLASKLPQHKLVVVRRPLFDVLASMHKAGLPVNEEEMIIRAAMLDALAASGKARVYEFNELADPLVCQDLFEFTLNLPFDWTWWRHCNGINVQIDVQDRLAKLLLNSRQMEILKREVKCETQKLDGRQLCLFN